MITSKATQEFVPIKEIREGVIVLRDNSLRMILMVSSLNFALKSEDEQGAIIMQFQNFLNSLDFSAQFFIESRKLNINTYISSLQEAEKEQVNELLKIQTREYIEFVKNFVKSTDIVSKTFYVSVPYSPGITSIKRGILGSLEKKVSQKNEKDMYEQFASDRIQLQQRADVVQQGLASSGLRVVPLNTEELIELFYKLFNPGELEKEVAQQLG